MGAVTSSEVHDFTGGLATVQAPHLIASNEAQKFVNVDISKGTITSIPKLGSVEPLYNGPGFYKFNGEVFSYQDFRSNVVWNNTWYWTDGVETKKQYPDGTIKDLGLPTPETELNTKEGYAGRPLNGGYVYTYTFYDRDTGAESAPAPVSKEIGITNNSIVVSGFEALPTDATNYRLYRVGGFLPSFTMVAELAFDSIPYHDKLDVTQIDGRLLTTIQTGPAPVGLNYLVELNGRFYGSVGNLIYWSDVGNPDSWYINNFIKFTTTISALSVSQSGLIISTLYHTHVLRGTGIEDFVLKRLSDQVGCSDYKSIAQRGKYAIWYDKGQWVACDGYSIELLTYNKIDAPDNIAALGAVVLDNVYYMLFAPALYPSNTLYPSDTLYPNDPPEEQSEEKYGTVVIDFKRGRGYSFGIHRHANTASIGLVNNMLHYGRMHSVSTGQIHSSLPCIKPFGECNDNMNCDDVPGNDGPANKYTVYDLATADEAEGLEELTYWSPQFIDGSRTNLKEYEKFRLVYNGKFAVQIELENGDLVIDDLIMSEVYADDFALLGIPKANNKSYSVTIKIKGKGTVDSIQHTWKPRELP